MNIPKISVLIPTYNRKHYIEQCINSALNQTFQDDYEIIVRDNNSTDDTFDFVRQRYANQISSGKLKLHRNEKNIGEYGNVTRLFFDASGKYFAVLHSDDLYLPHALQYLYETAEKFNADVLHTIRFLNSPSDGVIKENTPLQIMYPEGQSIKEAVVISNDQLLRFVKFINSSGFFGDIQYSFFKREFVFDNKNLINTRCSSLYWLFLAKVYVETPEIYYIRRDTADSGTRNQSNKSYTIYSMEFFEKTLSRLIEFGMTFDDFASKIELFRDHPEFKDMVKAKTFNVITNFYLKNRNYYSAGNIPEAVRQSVEKVFKRYFGDNASYPIFLFHLINFLPDISHFERAFFTPPPVNLNDLQIEAA